MQQPNFGETIIFGAAWVMLLTLAGVPMRFLMILAPAPGRRRRGLLPVRRATGPHRRLPVRRVGDIDTYQTDSAMRTLTAAACSARARRRRPQVPLPEPQTDYIFSVIGEEFGLIACLAIALIYMTIIARVLVKLLHEDDRFIVLATAGLVGQFGLQA
jgi:cell division protein FtsW